MANKHVYTDGFLAIAGLNCSSHHNTFEIGRELETLDQTTAASGGAREFRSGLRMANFSAGGFFDESGIVPSTMLDVDAKVSSGFPVISVPTDSTPSANVDAWVLHNVIRGTWSTPMQVGQLWAFSVSGQGRGDKGGAFSSGRSVTSASNGGTGYQAGAVASGSKAYCVLMVHSGSSGTFDFKVVSDADDTFGSATDRATFTQVAAASAPTFEVVEVSGAVTDTYWRDDWTPSAGTWVFSAAIVII